ncbi:MAG: hypothetical protein GQ555_01030 [Desulfobacterales bacterium]|nr:hypothetical protein [Desulfobacterales bacterium]
MEGTKIFKFIQKQSCNSLKRVNVDFPVWMIHSLDREAKRLGVPRQSLIKVLIAQHLEKSHA